MARVAKHYTEEPIEKWNVRHFTDYICDEHERIFGIPYMPYKGFQADAGMLGNLIGTTRKKGKYSKAVVKEWIDRSFATHNPPPQYPGMTLTFITTYRKNILQQILLEEKRKQDAVKAREEVENNFDELEEWL